MVQSQVLQDVLRRLDFAYQRFFAKEAGYPRFKDRDHYTSLTYPQVDAVAKTFSRKGYIYLSKLGFVKFQAHRAFPLDLVSRVNVKYHGGRWYLNATAEHPEVAAAPTQAGAPKTIGIDRGLIHFAAMSDGTLVDAPRHFRRSERKLARLQRRLSRKQKGSHNRGKAKAKVAKRHAKIANQRRDFLHKLSFRVVTQYDVIVMEELKVRNMVRNRRLAKSILDAGWSMFQGFVRYKSHRHGKRLVLVDPAGTSQTCVCGEPVPKDLSMRVHTCPACGLVENRDIVAAKVIEQRGLLEAA
jgi:putative transposase